MSKYAIYVGAERCPTGADWFDNAVSEARYQARKRGMPMAQVVHEPTGNLANVVPLPTVWAESSDRDLSVFDPCEDDGPQEYATVTSWAVDEARAEND